MFDQEPDKALVCAERCAMDADWDLVHVVTILIAKIKTARLREIDLIGCDGKFAADDAPGLHIDLRSIKGRFVWYFDIVDARVLERCASCPRSFSKAPVHLRIF